MIRTLTLADLYERTEDPLFLVGKDLVDFQTAFCALPSNAAICDELVRMRRDARSVVGLRRDLGDGTANLRLLGYFAGRFWFWSPVAAEDLQLRAVEHPVAS